MSRVLSQKNEPPLRHSLVPPPGDMEGTTSLYKASRWALGSQDVAPFPPNHCCEDWTGLNGELPSRFPALGRPSDPGGV